MMLQDSVSSGLTTEVAEGDFANINALGTLQIQARCLSSIDQYRGRIAVLRTIYGLGILRHRKDAIPDLEETGLRAVDLPGLPGTAFEKIQEYRTRMRGLRSEYNSAAPINRILPVELLIQIFSYLRPDFKFHRRWGMSILHICRYWTDVMYKTPRFWANLLATRQEVTELSGRKLNRYRLALEHSGSVPLSLSFRGLPMVLAELLHPHASRIVELHVDIARSIDGLNLLLNAHMPALQDLRITPWAPYRWFPKAQRRHSAKYVQLPKTLPALHTIKVAAGHFTMASSSLRCLELTACWCVGCHARDRRFDPILLALSQCTSLEELSLQNCLPEDSSNPVSLQGRCSPTLCAKLPHLRSLAIESRRHSVALIMSRLIVPPTVDLELSIPGRFKLPDAVDMPSLRAVNTAYHVEIDLYNPYERPPHLVICDDDGRRMLSITGPLRYYRERDNEDRDPRAPVFARYAQDVADIFASTTTVSSLSVVGRLMEYPEQPYDPWATIFDTFPSLEQLDIGQPVDSLPSVLDILGRPGTDGRCRCPSLRRLWLLWRTEAVWPWIIDAEVERYYYWYVEEDCDRIRDLRERSTVHVETDDKRTWLPYGIAETRVFSEAVISCLSRRKALGAAPLTELRIGILPPRDSDILETNADPQSPEDIRRDNDYLLQHYPDLQTLWPDSRLEKLLDGQVENLDVYLLDVSEW